MKKPKNGILEYFIFVIIGIVFVFSLYKVITLMSEYGKAQKEYAQLRQYVQVVNLDTASAKETVIDEAMEDIVQNVVQDTLSYESGMQEGDAETFMEIKVDLEALAGINPDVCGWLYIPAVDISYPVVQGEDNVYYLTHTFQKEENKSGAVFADANIEKPFEEANTVLHGHNMKDGSMFGRLKKLYQNKKAYPQKLYFYIYTQEHTYRYLVFAQYVTENVIQAYELSVSEPVVTLSTCYGSVNEQKWLVIQGILVEQK